MKGAYLAHQWSYEQHIF